MKQHKLRNDIRILVAILCTLTVTQAGARWANVASVPVSRLLKNIGDYVKAHPTDAQGYYTLGRIQSAAFAQDTDKLVVVQKSPLPSLPYSELSMQRDTTRRLAAHTIALLVGSTINYRRATLLNASNAISWLGLGFECEEALRFPQALGQVAAILPRPMSLGSAPPSNADRVREQSLRAYRRAYSLSITADLKSQGGFGTLVSQEAAEGIMRLQHGRTLTPQEQAEVADLGTKLKTLKSMPRAITPILLSLQGSANLSDLLAPGASVHFDLSGEGTKRAWPWVKPTTGILVWDPSHTGKITSGLQLFGNVTWWLFWRDGYAPVAALDNDHNGWLEGDELKGIAVWFDRNGNGVADPGEVVSLTSLGIRRIAVSATGRSENTLCNRHGIQFRDGSYGTTFDWTPTSL